MNKTKRKNIGFVLLVIGFLLLYGQCSYIDLAKNGEYIVVQITSAAYYKALRKSTWYNFRVKGKKYGGSYTEIKGWEREIMIPGYYLGIYSTKNPKTNMLLIDKPVSPNFNIDSLNRMGLDKSDINWWQL